MNGKLTRATLGRDEIADSNVDTLANGMSLGFFLRGMILVSMCFNAELPSASFSIYYYPKHVAFTLLFDLMFGAWHRFLLFFLSLLSTNFDPSRTMHNGHRWGMPFLWNVHSLHHSTR